MPAPGETNDQISSGTSITQPPPPPNPSADAGIATGTGDTPTGSGTFPDLDSLDVFTLTPVAALKMLCGSIENLVRITGDVPLTPPISQPTTPALGVIGAEKENFARHTREGSRRKLSESAEVVPVKAKISIASSEAHLAEPLLVIGADREPLNIQHGAIALKFYSKKIPPIGLEEYLLRLHEFCPMSTAVYLATSLYIHRLAVVERIIPVTLRNVHRLVLAGLRVAMKALEDQSYPHRRFAKVGGVSEPELGKLEVSFCFITNFELKVDKEMLLEHAKAIRDGTMLGNFQVGFQPQLPLPKDKRNLVVGQRKVSVGAVVVTRDAPAAI